MGLFGKQGEGEAPFWWALVGKLRNEAIWKYCMELFGRQGEGKAPFCWALVCKLRNEAIFWGWQRHQPHSGGGSATGLMQGVAAPLASCRGYRPYGSAGSFVDYPFFLTNTPHLPHAPFTTT